MFMSVRCFFFLFPLQPSIAVPPPHDTTIDTDHHRLFVYIHRRYTNVAVFTRFHLQPAIVVFPSSVVSSLWCDA
ncbi:hypothetical protein L195_g050683 [Trifolium pratense]|uniref:Secreted protein n=1 Tax=Trifolium pratense TaxID=57577 RepID=A0A2K3JVE7_TRIPR|nr:hypothetical protein L195_g050683 [Trifolium pratense]